MVSRALHWRIGRGLSLLLLFVRLLGRRLHGCLLFGGRLLGGLVLLHRVLARGRFVIALGHALLDKGGTLGAGQALGVGADFAGLLLFLGGDGERRAGRDER